MKLTTLFLSLSLTTFTTLLFTAPDVVDAKPMPVSHAFRSTKGNGHGHGKLAKLAKRHCPPKHNTTKPSGASSSMPPKATDPPPASMDSPYVLVDKFAGNNFFDAWDFNDFDDPTHGQVNYLTRDNAMKNNLSYVQPDQTVVMAVDDYTYLGRGQKRNSVRITTKKSYNGGLFIMDAYAMPHGCSVWPAWWTVGPGWPGGGEIDIVEGVHENEFNQYTLHTTEGCSLDANQRFTSKVLGTRCAVSGADNSGCGVLESKAGSYGRPFNGNGGGVFVLLWDDDGIKTWFFSRQNIPEDISSFNPDPSSWGEPASFFASTTCPGRHFKDHKMVINTTLCGDWAGNTFNSAESCRNKGSCSDWVMDPTHYTSAKWKLAYVATYQPKK